MAAVQNPAADAALDQQQQNLLVEEQHVTGKQTDLNTRQAASFGARDAELKPQEAALSSALAEPTPQRKETPGIPEFKPQPIVDAKEFQSLSYALLGMALIGGAASKGNWLGVSASLNGAMKGYLDGNQAVAKKHYEDYQREFTSAKAREDQANKEFERILTDRKLSINEKIQQYKIAAAKYDRQDMRMAAEQKSIDHMWEQLQAHKQAATKLQVQNSQVTLKLEMKGAGGGGGANGLTDEGAALAADLTAKGVALPGGGGKDSNKLRIDLLNRWSASGVTADDIASGRAETKANGAAMTQVTKDLTAIHPYGRMLDTNANIAIKIGEKLERTNSPLVNQGLNYLQTRVNSDPDAAEFVAQMRIVQTEAARVLNNPRLVGQLTDSARHEMQAVVDETAPVKTLTRVLKRVQQDGHNRIKEMETERENLSKSIRTPSGSGAPAPATAKLFSDADAIIGK
jgi:hypothetical protein